MMLGSLDQSLMESTDEHLERTHAHACPPCSPKEAWLNTVVQFFDKVDKHESEINPRGVVLYVADEVMKAHLSSSLHPHIL